MSMHLVVWFLASQALALSPAPHSDSVFSLARLSWGAGHRGRDIRILGVQGKSGLGFEDNLKEANKDELLRMLHHLASGVFQKQTHKKTEFPSSNLERYKPHPLLNPIDNDLQTQLQSPSKSKGNGKIQQALTDSSKESVNTWSPKSLLKAEYTEFLHVLGQMYFSNFKYPSDSANAENKKSNSPGFGIHVESHLGSDSLVPPNSIETTPQFQPSRHTDIQPSSTTFSVPSPLLKSRFQQTDTLPYIHRANSDSSIISEVPVSEANSDSFFISEVPMSKVNNDFSFISEVPVLETNSDSSFISEVSVPEVNSNVFFISQVPVSVEVHTSRHISRTFPPSYESNVKISRAVDNADETTVTISAPSHLFIEPSKTESNSVPPSMSTSRWHRRSLERPYITAASHNTELSTTDKHTPGVHKSAAVSHPADVSPAGNVSRNVTTTGQTEFRLAILPSNTHVSALSASVHGSVESSDLPPGIVSDSEEVPPSPVPAPVPPTSAAPPPSVSGAIKSKPYPTLTDTLTKSPTSLIVLAPTSVTRTSMSSRAEQIQNEVENHGRKHQTSANRDKYEVRELKHLQDPDNVAVSTSNLIHGARLKKTQDLLVFQTHMKEQAKLDEAPKRQNMHSPSALTVAIPPSTESKKGVGTSVHKVSRQKQYLLTQQQIQLQHHQRKEMRTLRHLHWKELQYKNQHHHQIKLQGRNHHQRNEKKSNQNYNPRHSQHQAKPTYPSQPYIQDQREHKNRRQIHGLTRQQLLRLRRNIVSQRQIEQRRRSRRNQLTTSTNGRANQNTGPKPSPNKSSQPSPFLRLVQGVSLGDQMEQKQDLSREKQEQYHSHMRNFTSSRNMNRFQADQQPMASIKPLLSSSQQDSKRLHLLPSMLGRQLSGWTNSSNSRRPQSTLLRQEKDKQVTSFAPQPKQQVEVVFDSANHTTDAQSEARPASGSLPQNKMADMPSISTPGGSARNVALKFNNTSSKIGSVVKNIVSFMHRRREMGISTRNHEPSSQINSKMDSSTKRPYPGTRGQERDKKMYVLPGSGAQSNDSTVNTPLKAEQQSLKRSNAQFTPSKIGAVVNNIVSIMHRRRQMGLTTRNHELRNPVNSKLDSSTKRLQSGTMRQGRDEKMHVLPGAQSKDSTVNASLRAEHQSLKKSNAQRNVSTSLDQMGVSSLSRHHALNNFRIDAGHGVHGLHGQYNGMIKKNRTQVTDTESLRSVWYNNNNQHTVRLQPPVQGKTSHRPRSTNGEGPFEPQTDVIKSVDVNSMEYHSRISRVHSSQSRRQITKTDSSLPPSQHRGITVNQSVEQQMHSSLISPQKVWNGIPQLVRTQPSISGRKTISRTSSSSGIFTDNVKSNQSHIIPFHISPREQDNPNVSSHRPSVSGNHTTNNMRTNSWQTTRDKDTSFSIPMLSSARKSGYKGQPDRKPSNANIWNNIQQIPRQQSLVRGKKASLTPSVKVNEMNHNNATFSHATSSQSNAFVRKTSQHLGNSLDISVQSPRRRTENINRPAMIGPGPASLNNMQWRTTLQSSERTKPLQTMNQFTSSGGKKNRVNVQQRTKLDKLSRSTTQSAKDNVSTMRGNFQNPTNQRVHFDMNGKNAHVTWNQSRAGSPSSGQDRITIAGSPDYTGETSVIQRTHKQQSPAETILEWNSNSNMGSQGSSQNVRIPLGGRMPLRNIHGINMLGSRVSAQTIPIVAGRMTPSLDRHILSEGIRFDQRHTNTPHSSSRNEALVKPSLQRNISQHSLRKMEMIRPLSEQRTHQETKRVNEFLNRNIPNRSQEILQTTRSSSSTNQKDVDVATLTSVRHIYQPDMTHVSRGTESDIHRTIVHKQVPSIVGVQPTAHVFRDSEPDTGRTAVNRQSPQPQQLDGVEATTHVFRGTDSGEGQTIVHSKRPSHQQKDGVQEPAHVFRGTEQASVRAFDHRQWPPPEQINGVQATANVFRGTEPGTGRQSPSPQQKDGIQTTTHVFRGTEADTGRQSPSPQQKDGIQTTTHVFRGTEADTGRTADHSKGSSPQQIDGTQDITDVFRSTEPIASTTRTVDWRQSPQPEQMNGVQATAHVFRGTEPDIGRTVEQKQSTLHQQMSGVHSSSLNRTNETRDNINLPGSVDVSNALNNASTVSLLQTKLSRLLPSLVENKKRRGFFLKLRQMFYNNLTSKTDASNVGTKQLSSAVTTSTTTKTPVTTTATTSTPTTATASITTTDMETHSTTTATTSRTTAMTSTTTTTTETPSTTIAMKSTTSATTPSSATTTAMTTPTKTPTKSTATPTFKSSDTTSFTPTSTTTMSASSSTTSSTTINAPSISLTNAVSVNQRKMELLNLLRQMMIRNLTSEAKRKQSVRSGNHTVSTISELRHQEGWELPDVSSTPPVITHKEQTRRPATNISDDVRQHSMITTAFNPGTSVLPTSTAFPSTLSKVSTDMPNSVSSASSITPPKVTTSIPNSDTLVFPYTLAKVTTDLPNSDILSKVLTRKQNMELLLKVRKMFIDGTKTESSTRLTTTQQVPANTVLPTSEMSNLVAITSIGLTTKQSATPNVSDTVPGIKDMDSTGNEFPTGRHKKPISQSDASNQIPTHVIPASNRNITVNQQLTIQKEKLFRKLKLMLMQNISRQQSLNAEATVPVPHKESLDNISGQGKLANLPSSSFSSGSSESSTSYPSLSQLPEPVSQHITSAYTPISSGSSPPSAATSFSTSPLTSFGITSSPTASSPSSPSQFMAPSSSIIPHAEQTGGIPVSTTSRFATAVTVASTTALSYRGVMVRTMSPKSSMLAEATTSPTSTSLSTVPHVTSTATSSTTTTRRSAAMSTTSTTPKSTSTPIPITSSTPSALLMKFESTSPSHVSAMSAKSTSASSSSQPSPSTFSLPTAEQAEPSATSLASSFRFGSQGIRKTDLSSARLASNPLQVAPGHSPSVMFDLSNRRSFILSKPSGGGHISFNTLTPLSWLSEKRLSNRHSADPGISNPYQTLLDSFKHVRKNPKESNMLKVPSLNTISGSNNPHVLGGILMAQTDDFILPGFKDFSADTPSSITRLSTSLTVDPDSAATMSAATIPAHTTTTDMGTNHAPTTSTATSVTITTSVPTNTVTSTTSTPLTTTMILPLTTTTTVGTTSATTTTEPTTTSMFTSTHTPTTTSSPTKTITTQTTATHTTAASSSGTIMEFTATRASTKKTIPTSTPSASAASTSTSAATTATTATPHAPTTRTTILTVLTVASPFSKADVYAKAIRETSDQVQTTRVGSWSSSTTPEIYITSQTTSLTTTSPTSTILTLTTPTTTSPTTTTPTKTTTTITLTTPTTATPPKAIIPTTRTTLMSTAPTSTTPTITITTTPTTMTPTATTPVMTTPPTTATKIMTTAPTTTTSTTTTPTTSTSTTTTPTTSTSTTTTHTTSTPTTTTPITTTTTTRTTSTTTTTTPTTTTTKTPTTSTPTTTTPTTTTTTIRTTTTPTTTTTTTTTTLTTSTSTSTTPTTTTTTTPTTSTSTTTTPTTSTSTTTTPTTSTSTTTTPITTTATTATTTTTTTTTPTTTTTILTTSTTTTPTTSTSTTTTPTTSTATTTTPITTTATTATTTTTTTTTPTTSTATTTTPTTTTTTTPTTTTTTTPTTSTSTTTAPTTSTSTTTTPTTSTSTTTTPTTSTSTTTTPTTSTSTITTPITTTPTTATTTTTTTTTPTTSTATTTTPTTTTTTTPTTTTTTTPTTSTSTTTTPTTSTSTTTTPTTSTSTTTTPTTSTSTTTTPTTSTSTTTTPTTSTSTITTPITTTPTTATTTTTTTTTPTTSTSTTTTPTTSTSTTTTPTTSTSTTTTPTTSTSTITTPLTTTPTTATTTTTTTTTPTTTTTILTTSTTTTLTTSTSTTTTPTTTTTTTPTTTTPTTTTTTTPTTTTPTTQTPTTTTFPTTAPTITTPTTTTAAISTTATPTTTTPTTTTTPRTTTPATMTTPTATTPTTNTPTTTTPKTTAPTTTTSTTSKTTMYTTPLVTDDIATATTSTILKAATSRNVAITTVSDKPLVQEPEVLDALRNLLVDFGLMQGMSHSETTNSNTTMTSTQPTTATTTAVTTLVTTTTTTATHPTTTTSSTSALTTTAPTATETEVCPQGEIIECSPLRRFSGGSRLSHMWTMCQSRCSLDGTCDTPLCSCSCIPAPRLDRSEDR